MDTSRYRQFLASLNEYVSLYDDQAARVTGRWIQSLDDLESSAQARTTLLDQLSRVSRSVTAIKILIQDHASKEPLPGAKEVIEETAADLLTEITELQKQCRLIDQVVSDRGLESLVGEFLSSVEFVMDYIQFSFNGSCLTTFTCPSVHGAGAILIRTDPGYRDALCALIGVTVSHVEIREGEFLKLLFVDDRSIAVSLRDEDAEGPEYAYFTSASGRSWSW